MAGICSSYLFESEHLLRVGAREQQRYANAGECGLHNACSCTTAHSAMWRHSLAYLLLIAQLDDGKNRRRVEFIAGSLCRVSHFDMAIIRTMSHRGEHGGIYIYARYVSGYQICYTSLRLPILPVSSNTGGVLLYSAFRKSISQKREEKKEKKYRAWLYEASDNAIVRESILCFFFFLLLTMASRCSDILRIPVAVNTSLWRSWPCARAEK